MTMAAAHGMQSIAMPLIGHGLAGWPAKLAAQIHVEQVVQFFKASTAACSVKVLGKSYACADFGQRSCCPIVQSTYVYSIKFEVDSLAQILAFCGRLRS